MRTSLTVVAAALALVLSGSSSPALAQPSEPEEVKACELAARDAAPQTAPVPRLVVPAEAAPESVSGLFVPVEPGENLISIPDAEWLQVRFTDFQLGPGGQLTISGGDQSQTFDQRQLEDWGGLSAVFNGSQLLITLIPGEGAPGEPDEIAATIGEVVIGLPGRSLDDTEAPVPSDLLRLFGDDIERFIPDDVSAPMEEAGALETICGTNDDRAASNHAWAGRVVPVGCTGWLIRGGLLLTAGHCLGAAFQTVEFNVPASQANGTIVASQVRDQYRIVAGSIVSGAGGIGNDWAVFRVLPNTVTGLTPHAAQGGAFAVSNTANPANVRITGFGVDGPAPGFGAGGPRDATNQTQQTHTGALTGNTGGASTGTLNYAVDTQGGNSGSPVFGIADNVAIGIHTNGGCGPTGGANAGTSFRNQALWRAMTRTGDLLWQHSLGQVHYWPMQNGQRQGGLNIFTPVGGDWRLVGAGDVDGDGDGDVLWQHALGQVHYWPMQNGQRQGGINIHTPVGGDWRLVGAGDLDRDGDDDLIWQHMFGQVHYWPMQNGQRQGGINIHTPVGRDWRLAGAGDVDNDGDDDLIWQHVFGQVHYWPIQNGQRQGGINIHTPVGGDWRLVGAGDVDGDGDADILWQHAFGQVHYWPIQNGQRQGGINIHTPVGGDWRLVGVGELE